MFKSLLAVVGGTVAVVLAVLGFVYWGDKFVILLQGFVPVILLIGGAIAVWIGVSNFRSEKSEL